MLPSYRYWVERRKFNAWARWRENQWDVYLGVPKVTALAKIGELGIRVGVVNYVSSDPIPDYSGHEHIVTLMDEWRLKYPAMHRAIMCRHCERMTDREGALAVYGDGSKGCRKAFQKQCLKAYDFLRNSTLNSAGPSGMVRVSVRNSV